MVNNKLDQRFYSEVYQAVEGNDYIIKQRSVKLDWDLKITDMAGATPEHSAVIVNFVAAIRYQLKNSTCYVYSDNVQYRFKDNQGNNKIVIPDASINCRTKSRRGNTFTDAPRFVMESSVTINRKL